MSLADRSGKAQNDAITFCESAKRFNDQHDYASAMRAYCKALQLDARCVQAYIGRARTCLKLNDVAGAIEDCLLALELQPGYASAYRYLGNAYLMQGKMHEAVTSYSQALQLAPQPATVYAHRARAFLALGEYQQAAEDLSFCAEAFAGCAGRLPDPR